MTDLISLTSGERARIPTRSRSWSRPGGSAGPVWRTLAKAPAAGRPVQTSDSGAGRRPTSVASYRHSRSGAGLAMSPFGEHD